MLAHGLVEELKYFRELEFWPQFKRVHIKYHILGHCLQNAQAEGWR